MRQALSCTAAKSMVQRTVEPIFPCDSGAFAGTAGERNHKTMLTSIARLYQAWKRHEAVRRELSHLTDRELADIGITRSDIDRIASEEAHS
jgi:uncharacterized protein YjiS (DUF1127 family)